MTAGNDALPVKSIAPALKRFDDELFNVLVAENKEIAESIRLLIKGRGKRVRPILALLSAGATGCRNDDPIRYAIITELIHTASIFHDDVLDDATFRRGVISSNLLLGNNLSVLAGDYLYAKALSLVFEDGREIQQIVNNTVLSMTKGEISQGLYRHRFDGGKERYMWIIERKTADLMSLPCRLGALISGSDQQVEQLSAFGRRLGIAFQVIDDLLDWTAETKKFGKKTFQDAREGNITLPVFLLLEKLPESQAEEIKNLLRNSEKEDPDTAYQELRDLMVNTGVVDEIHDFTLNLSQEALNDLDDLPPSPELDDLKNLVAALLKRTH